VTAADDGGVTLDVDGAATPATWADLGPGKVQVELKRLAEIPDDEFDEDDDGEDEE